MTLRRVTLRRIQLSAVAMVLFICFFTSGLAQPARRDTGLANVPTINANAATINAAVPMVNAAVTPASNWVFEGCWTQFSAGPCRDIFRDQQGQTWICRACGTTGNPGPGKCNPISSATLASGFWCS